MKRERPGKPSPIGNRFVPPGISARIYLGRKREPMDERFRFLDHTADAKFQAYGRTLEEAFANAALAVASLMWEPAKVEKKLEQTVGVEGRDLEQLLVRFLGEVIYLLETRSFLAAEVDRLAIEKTDGGFRLGAVLRGDDRPARYALFGHVKAVTYNEMRIDQGCPVTVQVVVDV
jgi:SHS2 domain-containing protein